MLQIDELSARGIPQLLCPIVTVCRHEGSLRIRNRAIPCLLRITGDNDDAQRLRQIRRGWRAKRQSEETVGYGSVPTALASAFRDCHFCDHARDVDTYSQLHPVAARPCQCGTAQRRDDTGLCFAQELTILPHIDMAPRHARGCRRYGLGIVLRENGKCSSCGLSGLQGSSAQQAMESALGRKLALYGGRAAPQGKCRFVKNLNPACFHESLDGIFKGLGRDIECCLPISCDSPKKRRINDFANKPRKKQKHDGKQCSPFGSDTGFRREILSQHRVTRPKIVGIPF